MNADAESDPFLGGDIAVPWPHASLHLERGAPCVDDAGEIRSAGRVAYSIKGTTVMGSNHPIDQLMPQRAPTRASLPNLPRTDG